MDGTYTRRRALALSGGAAAMAASCGKDGRRETGPDGPGADKSWWGPSANKDYVRTTEPGPTPVRLACMSADTMLNRPDDGDIRGMVKRIRDRGYTAANGHSRMGVRNGWLKASDTEIAGLKEALAEFDVDFYDIMVWTNLIHPDERKRRENIRHVTETFEAAERAGVRSITGITGSMAPGDYAMHTLMHPDNWTGEAWKRSVESIRRILNDTAGFTTVWGMEQCITTAVDSPLATRRIIDDVADPRCKCVLDVTNMISLATYYHSTELIDEVFDLLGEEIVGAHAKDFRLNPRMLVDLVEVPPGQGLQDYGTYLARLSRLSWPRTLMLEHFPADQYPPAKAYIEETARTVGVTIYG